MELAQKAKQLGIDDSFTRIFRVLSKIRQCLLNFDIFV